jgi:hypothetical protein
MKPLCLLLLCLTGALLGARGETFRTDINPALLYYRALLVATEPMSDEDSKYLESKKGKEEKLPERFGKIVAGCDNQFLLVRQAAHSTVPCDWGIDLSPGPYVLLPHLARARMVCRTAQLRARWALEHGRQEEARDELIASFALARNMASDGLLISALVQYASEGIGHETVARYFGEFSPETLKQLVDGFDAAPAAHTIAACVTSEKGLVDWFLRKIQERQKAHPNDDTKAMAYLQGVFSAAYGDANFWPRIVAAAGGTSQGIVKLIHGAESVMPPHAEIMALRGTEYETRAKAFFAECRQSQNPLIAESASGWEKARPREFRAEAQLAMVRAAVEYKLRGEPGLKSVMDPFGSGPFGFQRFVFNGVDRGFELKSVYTGAEGPFTMIFVEKQGPAFQVIGPDAGKALDQ